MKTIIVCFWLLVSGIGILDTGYWLLVPGEELKLTVSNIDPIEGNIYIAIYDSDDTYMDIEKTAYREIVKVTSETQSILLDDIAAGEYAIAIFQDLNGNGELDTKGMGMPVEPFGFSNDARGKFGPPKFKNAMFTFPNENEIQITLVNNEKK